MGTIYVFYGPSASGKTQVQQQLAGPHFPRIITATTRKPRTGEVDGIHYRFLDKQQFQDRIEQNELVEWTDYNGNYYGTQRSSVEEIISGAQNGNIIMDLSGVLALKQQYGPYISAVYIGADIRSLSRRLLERGSDSTEVSARIVKAREEELSGKYLEEASTVIWNNDDTDFAETLQQVRDFIAASESPTSQ